LNDIGFPVGGVAGGGTGVISGTVLVVGVGVDDDAP